MGRKERIKPERLAEKLVTIRTKLHLTSEELIEKLNCPKVTLYRATIWEFEKGRREPPSLILLAYARLVGMSVDYLIDDDIDLPDQLSIKLPK